MAHLFSKIVLTDALKNVSISDIESKIAVLQEWNEMYKRGELQKKKETAFEATYSEKLFGAILGYSDVSGRVYTREKHPKNTSNGQTCDIGLGYYSSEKNETQAVVELKDAGTSIDRPQQREGNMTPIQQGFKYKPLYNSRWVVVSNYYEFRLYRDTYQDYEVWTLADLVNPANDYEKFRTFYLLLRAESLISETGESETEKLLAKVRIEQETITKKFYKEYSGLREELMRDIWKNNPTLRNESVVTITQRIIDRIVFVHFCEDRGLLPQNKLAENLTRAKEIDLTPWEVLILYFRGIDKGSEKLGIPDGYNGGLFRDDDDAIKNLKVSDDVITKFIELGRYDFSDEGGQLSVEILGHIFEQSISDLESIREKIKNPGGESDEKKVSKRKKDGIFYTPAYIVDYIVRNSLGKYLEEHEERIKEQYKLKGDITEKNYRKREIEAYTEYQKILHTVKVLDPACGSGAFLVRVFDFLLEENKRVANILTEGAQSDLFQSEMYFREILKNNIYGVDLNEESVEITKLSLWLKSAVRGKKLETLDNNIKCGNSLIYDPAVAGDKAFNWNTEFADIMASGGFDVIVGNPPYVQLQSMKSESEKLQKEGYKTFEKTGDLYCLFYELAVTLIQKGGFLGFITSNKWMRANYGKSLRKFLIENTKPLLLLDLGSGIFESATVDSNILLLRKSSDREVPFFAIDLIKEKNVLDLALFMDKKVQINPKNEDSWIISSPVESGIKQKIENIGTPLKKWDIKINYGIKTGFNEAFIIDKDVRDKLISEDPKCDEILKPILRGRDIQRYHSDYADLWLINSHNGYGEKPRVQIEQYPSIKNYLDKFWKEIEQRYDKGDTPYNLRNCVYVDDFFGYNLFYPDISQRLSFTLVSDIFTTNTGYFLRTDSKFLLSFLNSALINYYYKTISAQLGETGLRSFTIYIENIPVPKLSTSEQQPFIEKADLMLSLNQDLQERSGSFLKNIQAKYSVSKITRKLEKWWELDFAEFLKETKISISLAEQEELMNYFETRRTEAQAIDAEIRKTDSEIDNMVFDLYGLTEEERKVVLGS